MKHFLLFLCMMSWLAANAYDFMVENIAYNKNSDGNSVSVTYTHFGNNYPGITNLSIPQSVFYANRLYNVTAISDYAFYECETLKSLIIPTTVQTIGDYAAFGCEKLNTLSIGSNVKTIGKYAFSETSLLSVDLPLSVISIDNYAFAECTKLTQLETGNGLKQIGRSAFFNCTSLVTATLGAQVNSIGTNAFAGCSALHTLNVNMPDPTKVTVNDNSFDGVDKASCLLCVPRGTLDLYSTAPVWQEFQQMSDASDGYGLQLNFKYDSFLRSGFAQLEIGLANEEQVSALQCDIILPQGMIVTQTAGEYDITINEERRGSDHGLTVNKTGTNKYTLLLSSPSGKAFKGNSGTLMTMNLYVGDMTLGYYNIFARNASIAKPSSEMLYLNDLTLPIIISRCYLLGDANGDGMVDVADYVVTANKLVGKTVITFYNDAADVNQNGGVDIGDLVGITHRSLGIITPEIIETNN